MELPLRPGIIKPQVVEVPLQIHSQVVGPGFVFRQIKTFGGAAAHRNDRQVGGENSAGGSGPRNPRELCCWTTTLSSFPKPVMHDG